MKKRIFIIFLLLSLFCYGTINAQDTLVGWTFPVGWTNTKSDTNIGNALNSGGMFITADSSNDNGRPFTPSISLSFNGYHTKSASTVLWDHAKDLKCWKFSCVATGYENLKIYARVSSDSNNPGPRDFKIQYNLGCCNSTWYDVPGAAPFKVSTDWTTGFVNGIEIPEVADSMAGLNIRFVCTSDTATDGSILKTTSRSLIDEVYVTGDNMISINDNKPDHSIAIYPNPANDYIQIRSKKHIKTYKILDLTGRMLKSDQLNSTEFKISFTDLKPGCYFIDLGLEGNGHLVRRVIIK
jgi:hypothetical protein